MLGWPIWLTTRASSRNRLTACGSAHCCRLRTLIAAGVTGAAGCYRPVEVACGVTCAGGTCPGQLVCNAADQLCYAPATGACSETGDDGLPKTDCFGSGPFRVCVAPPDGPQSWA